MLKGMNKRLSLLYNCYHEMFWIFSNVVVPLPTPSPFRRINDRSYSCRFPCRWEEEHSTTGKNMTVYLVILHPVSSKVELQGRAGNIRKYSS